MYVKTREGLTVDQFYIETMGEKNYPTSAGNSTFRNADEKYCVDKLSREEQNKMIQNLIDNPRVLKLGYYSTTTYVPGYYNYYILVKYKKDYKW